MLNASSTTAPKGPKIDITKFRTSPTAAWHDYKQKFVAFMASHKGFWTTVMDPHERLEMRFQNPWTTANSVEGRAKRAEHAAVAGLMLRELTEFSDVPERPGPHWEARATLLQLDIQETRGQRLDPLDVGGSTIEVYLEFLAHGSRAPGNLFLQGQLSIVRLRSCLKRR